MNNALLFLILALALSLLVVLLLGWYAHRAAKAAASGQERAHVMSHITVYREQLSELERELEQGSLDPAGFDLSKAELTQRLMEDAPANEAAAEARPAQRVRWLIALMALVIPVAAFSVYMSVGTPMALDPALMAQAKAFCNAASVWS